MGHVQSQHLPDDHKANLEVARQLWEKLKGIPGLRIEDAMIHFLCIMHMGELLALSNREVEKKQKGVFDVLCCGVTDGATVMGVSSRLRKFLAAEAVNQQLCQNVGAFDGAMSRLSEQAEGEPPKSRPFDTCAEHVVFEKLGRLGATANSTYAVQMVKLKSSGQDFTIKIVERCENCKVAGGPSSPPTADHPFGSTPRLGAVVTDSPALINSPIPVLTAPVLRIVRDTLGGADFSDTSREVVTRRFPSLRVFLTPSWQGDHRVLEILGPEHELEEIYPNDHVHDEL